MRVRRLDSLRVSLPLFLSIFKFFPNDCTFYLPYPTLRGANLLLLLLLLIYPFPITSMTPLNVTCDTPGLEMFFSLVFPIYFTLLCPFLSTSSRFLQLLVMLRSRLAGISTRQIGVGGGGVRDMYLFHVKYNLFRLRINKKGGILCGTGSLINAGRGARFRLKMGKNKLSNERRNFSMIN